MRVCEKVSRELHCQKWLFTNVKINPINMKLITKINDNKKLRRLKRRLFQDRRALVKLLEPATGACCIYKKNGKNNHKNHNSNTK